MSLRGPVLTLTARPEGPSLMGRTDGHQKCPMFLILFGNIELVYIYLYTKKELSSTFLWVSKFDVKLGVWVKFSNLLQLGDFSIFRSKSSNVQGVFLKIILALANLLHPWGLPLRIGVSCAD